MSLLSFLLETHQKKCNMTLMRLCMCVWGTCEKSVRRSLWPGISRCLEKNWCSPATSASIISLLSLSMSSVSAHGKEFQCRSFHQLLLPGWRFTAPWACLPKQLLTWLHLSDEQQLLRNTSVLRFLWERATINKRTTESERVWGLSDLLGEDPCHQAGYLRWTPFLSKYVHGRALQLVHGPVSFLCTKTYLLKLFAAFIHSHINFRTARSD